MIYCEVIEKVLTSQANVATMIYFKVLEISDPNINKGIPCLIRNFM